MTTVHHQPAPPVLPHAGAPRSPRKQWGLAVVTFGIYAAVHHYRRNRELRDFGLDVDPLKATLAFFPGCLLLVPYLITAYRTGQRIAVAQETADLSPSIRPELSCVAALIAFLQVPYHQSQLNRVWAAHAAEVSP